MAANQMTTRPKFGAYVSDNNTLELMTSVATGQGFDKSNVRIGGVDTAARDLMNNPSPEILLVDLSDSLDPRADMQSLAEVCDPDTAVIAIGSVNDVSLFRELLHAGVQDYLVKPLNADQVLDSVLAALELIAADQSAQEEVMVDPASSRQIAIIGLRGGLGASTLAANIAWQLADTPQKTLLLDLDLQFGTSAMQFDLESGRGLIDALENPARVDGLFLERAVIKPTQHLSVLASEAPIGTTGRLLPGAVKGLIGVLTDSFSSLVIDFPRHLLADQSDALESVTDIVLVTDLTLTGARDAIRMIGHAEKAAPHAKIYVIAAKVGSQSDEVEKPDFENSIDRDLDALLPFDPKSYLMASKSGKMVAEINPTSKAAQSIRSLACKLNPLKGHEEEQSESWLQKLFGFGK